MCLVGLGVVVVVVVVVEVVGSFVGLACLQATFSA